MNQSPLQAAERISNVDKLLAYENAGNFFRSTPPVLNSSGKLLQDAAPAANADTNADGSVQFQLIGMQTTDPRYSAIMNENAANLLSIGGLIYNYMHRTYPTVDAQKLDINTWNNVVSNIPDLSLGKSVNKTYTNTVVGTQVSGEFLSLIAKAVITEGASLLTDFQSYLTAVGNVVFSANVKSESYNIMNCTYTSYLVDNKMGGYFDYGAITLRQITFNENFQQYKSVCGSAELVKINMTYTEIVNLVQTEKIRTGGADYNAFQNLISGNSAEQFKNAGNFFNAPAVPQNQITPAG